MMSKRGVQISFWLCMSILSNALIGSYIVISRQVEHHLTIVVPPMRAITYLKSITTVIFFFVIFLPAVVKHFLRKLKNEDAYKEPFLQSGPPPSFSQQLRWTCVIIVAAFLRIASETVAPYYAKAYLVLFVQMQAPLLVALCGRLLFNVELPKGFVTGSVAMVLAACVTIFGSAELWKESDGASLSQGDVLGMVISLLGVLSIVVILYAVSGGKQILGERFILFLIMSSMLLFAPWLSLLEQGSLLDFLKFTPNDWFWVIFLGFNNFSMIYFQNLVLYNLGAPTVSIFIPLRLLVAVIGSSILLDEPVNNWVEGLGLFFIFLVTLAYVFTQYREAVRKARELSEMGDEVGSMTRLGTPLSSQQMNLPVDVLSQE